MNLFIKGCIIIVHLVEELVYLTTYYLKCRLFLFFSFKNKIREKFLIH